MTTPWRTKIINKDIPCAIDGGCPKRTPGCHDKCPEWQVYLTKRAARIEQRRKDEESEELYYHLVNRSNRRIAKRKQHLPKRNPHKG